MYQLFLSRHITRQTRHVTPVTEGEAPVARLKLQALDRPRPSARRVTRANRDSGRGVARRVVLVVEDDADAREMLAIILGAAGCQVRTAADGNAGLEAVEKHRVDLVVTDIAMPRMDGIQMVEQLRQKPAMKEVPVIAVTGQAVADVPAKARAAGCNLVLSKPCCPDHLVSIVNQHIGRRREDRMPAAGRHHYSGHDRRRS